MDFQKMKWIDVPDPENDMPTIADIPDRPEYQMAVLALDAENMNRIEEGIESAHEITDNIPFPVNIGGTGATTAEQARENLGVPKIKAATYTGDGAKFRTINLGFTPSAVLVYPTKGAVFYSYNAICGGLAVKDSPTLGYTYQDDIVVSVVDNGFQVSYRDEGNYDAKTNQNNLKYNYIAWG